MALAAPTATNADRGTLSSRALKIAINSPRQVSANMMHVQGVGGGD
jgi:hypothetical protein